MNRFNAFKTYSSEKKFCPNLFNASFRYFLTMALPCLWKYLQAELHFVLSQFTLKVNTCQSFRFVQSQLVVHLSNLSLNADNNLDVEDSISYEVKWRIISDLKKGCLVVIILNDDGSSAILLSCDLDMKGAICLACMLGWLN